MRTTKPNPKLEAIVEGGVSPAAPTAKPAGAGTAEIVLFADASGAVPYAGLQASPHRRNDDSGLRPAEDGESSEMMTSSCGDHEGHVSSTACPSLQLSEGCFELMHELSNLMTNVLLNAQTLEWKLPPYSHLKRPVREVARNAQRAGELMKRMQRRCDEAGRQVQAAHYPAEPAMPPLDLTHGCDSCTSEVFPKRDDRDGR